MKKTAKHVISDTDRDELRPEYDFARMKGGVQGKYYKAYRAGHAVKVHKKDGTLKVRHFTLAEGAVLLEPDVQAYFPNSEAVNTALRCLIPLISKKSKAKVS
jgi:hypothetical protein